MKKLLTLNIGEKVFRDKYVAACETSGIQADVIRSRNSIFVLENGTVSLFHKEERILPSEYGYVFIRVAGHFALMTSLIARYFKESGVALSDTVYLEHTKNEEKVTQMLVFSLSNIPIPKTVLFTIDGFAENKDFIKNNMTFPCVLKTNGSQGRNVWKIEDGAQLGHRITDLPISAEVAMIQEFISNSYDIRAIYAHSDVIGAISRSSADGFLNNVSAGGTAERIDLTQGELEITKRACRVLGRSFAGVDIVRTANGPLIFEVNLGPQVSGFESATGIDVPAALVERIKRDYLDS